MLSWSDDETSEADICWGVVVSKTSEICWCRGHYSSTWTCSAPFLDHCHILNIHLWQRCAPATRHLSINAIKLIVCIAWTVLLGYQAKESSATYLTRILVYTITEYLTHYLYRGLRDRRCLIMYTMYIDYWQRIASIKLACISFILYCQTF